MSDNVLSRWQNPRDPGMLYYGLPIEPFATGELAATSQGTTEQAPDIGPGTPETAGVYQDAHQRLMQSPFYNPYAQPWSRIGIAPMAPEVSGLNVLGSYLAKTDTGFARPSRKYPASRNLAHEVLHRDLWGLGNWIPTDQPPPEKGVTSRLLDWLGAPRTQPSKHQQALQLMDKLGREIVGLRLAIPGTHHQLMSMTNGLEGMVSSVDFKGADGNLAATANSLRRYYPEAPPDPHDAISYVGSLRNAAQRRMGPR